jgi:hypothetical protein
VFAQDIVQRRRTGFLRADDEKIGQHVSSLVIGQKDKSKFLQLVSLPRPLNVNAPEAKGTLFKI